MQPDLREKCPENNPGSGQHSLSMSYPHCLCTSASFSSLCGVFSSTDLIMVHGCQWLLCLYLEFVLTVPIRTTNPQGNLPHWPGSSPVLTPGPVTCCQESRVTLFTMAARRPALCRKDHCKLSRLSKNVHYNWFCYQIRLL